MQLRALKAAFPLTLPILASFLLLGIACGIFASSLGLAWWIPPLMAVVIFAGSAEFACASLLVAPFAPVQAFLLALVINARHLFYGISLLDRLPKPGRTRPYLIYALCDETFSLIWAKHAPESVDEGWFMFWIAALNQLYWVLGCLLGGLFGAVLNIQIEGVGFTMTALFCVILLEQCERREQVPCAAIGIAASAGALALFGPDAFVLPAMAAIGGIMLAARPWLDPDAGEPPHTHHGSRRRSTATEGKRP